jgi:hypothetical protein
LFLVFVTSSGPSIGAVLAPSHLILELGDELRCLLHLVRHPDRLKHGQGLLVMLQGIKDGLQEEVTGPQRSLVPADVEALAFKGAGQALDKATVMVRVADEERFKANITRARPLV